MLLCEASSTSADTRSAKQLSKRPELMLSMLTGGVSVLHAAVSEEPQARQPALTHFVA